jgi:hypothetical protein
VAAAQDQVVALPQRRTPDHRRRKRKDPRGT